MDWKEAAAMSNALLRRAHLFHPSDFHGIFLFTDAEKNSVVINNLKDCVPLNDRSPILSFFSYYGILFSIAVFLYKACGVATKYAKKQFL
jgi:hypothetical protein